MSDQKLRELERRWRETGSVEDEAAYLRERVRVGDLTQERLELAAYCGNQGASVALDVPQAECSRTDLASWCLGLGRWRQQLVVLALLEALEPCVPLTDGTVPGPRVRLALESLRRWCHGDSVKIPDADPVLVDLALSAPPWGEARFAMAEPLYVRAALAVVQLVVVAASPARPVLEKAVRMAIDHIIAARQIDPEMLARAMQVQVGEYSLLHETTRGGHFLHGGGTGGGATGVPPR